MPTVLRWHGHRFSFYSREPDEPPHVHVIKGRAQAKFWLTDRERGMTSLAESEKRNQIAEVRFDDERMHVLLQDGRQISVPLWWYPRLLHATPSSARKTWTCGAF